MSKYHVSQIQNGMTITYGDFNANNPKEAIQNMVMSNPKLQNVMQLFQNSNLSPKQFFYQYAEQNGVDPDQFINSL